MAMLDDLGLLLRAGMSMAMMNSIFCLFLLLSSAVFVDSNFRNNPVCYHDKSRSCRQDSVTRNVSLEELKKISANVENVSVRGIYISSDFVYPSSSAYCYPYLNLTWNILPDVLNVTWYFHIKISFEHLGERSIINKLMIIKKNKTSDASVALDNFSYACLQLAYPGVIYATFVSALNEDLEVLSYSNPLDFSGPCTLKLHRNMAMKYPGSTLKDDWIPNYRVVQNNQSMKIYFTMPDCKIGIWSTTVELNHVEMNKIFSSRRFQCVCPFKDLVTIDSLPAGNYTLTFYTDTTTSTTSKVILRHQIEFLNGASASMEPIKKHFTAGIPNAPIPEQREIKTTDHLIIDGEGDDFKSKLWITVGIIIIILWLSTLSLFFYRVKSSNQEINICVRGSLKSMKKDRNGQGPYIDSTTTPKTKSREHSLCFDSGISSKCSRLESLHSDQLIYSTGHVNTSMERCSVCSGNCPDCDIFNFEIRFTPPSEVDFSMSNDEILAKINSFNTLQNDF